MLLDGVRFRRRVVLGLLTVLTPAVVAATGPTAAAEDQREVLALATGTDGLIAPLALAYSLAEDSAHAQGVPLYLNSGYRTWAEQQQLWEDGIATYGSPDAARRWVLPPEESSHVAGEAIDVGPEAGAQWLETHGNRWGLCRTFINEWWHFEIATVPGGACPPMLPDASER
ncbi:M15 family metallopeptidase [Nocardia takedensis]